MYPPTRRRGETGFILEDELDQLVSPFTRTGVGEVIADEAGGVVEETDRVGETCEEEPGWFGGGQRWVGEGEEEGGQG